MSPLEKIRKFCAYQERSVAEVRAKLKGYIVPQEDIENIINQLIDEEILNDERFAHCFASGKLRAKGWGYAKIRYGLQQKGISNDIINSILSDVEETDWNDQLQKNIEKWKKLNTLNRETYPKLVRFLVSKGFRLSEVMKNINLFWISLIIILLQSCAPLQHIVDLKQNHYYFTQINEKEYVVKVDTIIEVQSSKFKVQSSKFKVQGSKFKVQRKKTLNSQLSTLNSTAYLIDSSEFTSPQQFQIEYQKKKPKVFLDGVKASASHTFSEYVAPVITEFPQRYLDTIFDTYLYRDVAFAQVEGYWDSNLAQEDLGKVFLGSVASTISKKKLNLKMDIFVPKNAGNKARPLLMLIHGGAFYVGDKSEDAIVRMCQYFASMGYTTATINYRMGFLPAKASSERAGYMALQDAHAALRFLFENANKYKIDTNYVFVGGSSAGGITSLNLAFMQNKNRPESSYKSLLHDDLGNIESAGKFNNTKIHINAIANLWGAVNDLAVLKNRKVSVLSYHSAKDPIVPYDYDYPMQKFAKKVAPLLFTKMYGSKAIHEELKKLKYREKLVTIQQEAHNLWETNDKINTIFYQIFNDMKQFFYVDLVPNPVKIERDALFCQRYFISNTSDIELVTWQCDGGFIIQNNENEILVIWRSDAIDRRLTSSGIYKNGAAFKIEIKK